MKKLITAAFAALLTTTSFAGTQCKDFSGSYRIDFKRDCSKSSYKILTDHLSASWGKGLPTAVPIGSRTREDSFRMDGELHFTVDRENYPEVTFDIEQEGCKKLKIITFGEGLDHIDQEEHFFSIDKSSIKKKGFKFRNFEGGDASTSAGLGFAMQNTVLKIQETDEQDTIKIKSKSNFFGLFFYLIPMFERDEFLDCKIQRD